MSRYKKDTEKYVRVPWWTWIFMILCVLVGLIGFYTVTYVFVAFGFFTAYHTYAYNRLNDALYINKFFNSLGLLGITTALMLLLTWLRIVLEESISFL